MFPALFIGFSAALRYWAIKRLLSDDASQRGLQHRRLDDEGLHIESTGITARVSWSALRSAIETPGFFLLFQSRDCAYYLPKRAMTDESVTAARLLLKEQMQVRSRLSA